MLTKREKEVLRLAGYTREQIAEKLCLSIGTVKSHLVNIHKKLKTKSKEQAILLALKGKILDIREVDIGFWDSNGIYIEDIQEVDFTKE